MTVNKQTHIPDCVLEQAIDWMIRLEDAPNDKLLRQRFEIWRTKDCQHNHAWQKANQAWASMENISPYKSKWPQQATKSYSIPSLAYIKSLCCNIRGLTMIAVSACLLLTILPTIQLHLQADHITAVGETKVISLADGSLVHLGGASAITTNYANGKRRINLLSGQAFFEVKSNPEQPFIVSTKHMDVTVLGTAFDVQLGKRIHTVSVKNGSVNVTYADKINQQLKPGELLTIERDKQLASISHISTHNVAAWREGRLFVHDRSIEDVVEILARYNSGKVMIINSKLATRHVSGSYLLHKPNMAIQALVGPYNGNVLALTPMLKVLYED